MNFYFAPQIIYNYIAHAFKRVSGLLPQSSFYESYNLPALLVNVVAKLIEERLFHNSFSSRVSVIQQWPISSIILPGSGLVPWFNSEQYNIPPFSDFYTMSGQEWSQMRVLWSLVWA